MRAGCECSLGTQQCKPRPSRPTLEGQYERAKNLIGPSRSQLRYTMELIDIQPQKLRVLQWWDRLSASCVLPSVPIPFQVARSNPVFTTTPRSYHTPLISHVPSHSHVREVRQHSSIRNALHNCTQTLLDMHPRCIKKMRHIVVCSHSPSAQPPHTAPPSLTTFLTRLTTRMTPAPRVLAFSHAFLSNAREPRPSRLLA